MEVLSVQNDSHHRDSLEIHLHPNKVIPSLNVFYLYPFINMQKN